MKRWQAKEVEVVTERSGDTGEELRVRSRALQRVSLE